MSAYEAFASVDMRVGTIVRVELNEKARNPAYKMWIDLGGTRDGDVEWAVCESLPGRRTGR